MTIKKGEKVADFDIKFLDLVNQLQLVNNENIIIIYYINAFRNWPRMYEHLLEEEPKTLKEVMDFTSKKEKIFNLLGNNKQKPKESTSKISHNSNGNNKVTNNSNNNNNNNFRPFYNNISNNDNNYFNKYSSQYSKTNNNNSQTTNKNYYNCNGNLGVPILKGQ